MRRRRHAMPESRTAAKEVGSLRQWWWWYRCTALQEQSRSRSRTHLHRANGALQIVPPNVGAVERSLAVPPANTLEVVCMLITTAITITIAIAIIIIITIIMILDAIFGRAAPNREQCAPPPLRRQQLGAAAAAVGCKLCLCHQSSPVLKKHLF